MKKIFLTIVCFAGLIACSKSDDNKKASVALSAPPAQTQDLRASDFCNKGVCLTPDELSKIKNTARREFEKYSRQNLGPDRRERIKSSILNFAYRRVKGTDIVLMDQEDNNFYLKLYNYVFETRYNQNNRPPRYYFGR
jgi:hypothetical protein